jgi:hypothetical protein
MNADNLLIEICRAEWEEALKENSDLVAEITFEEYITEVSIELS